MRREPYVERAVAELAAAARVVVAAAWGAFRLLDRWVASAGRRPALLDVAGLGLLSVAAGMLAPAAGVAAAGVGCLLMSWRLSR
jgi:hypothetical protein